PVGWRARSLARRPVGPGLSAGSVGWVRSVRTPGGDSPVRILVVEDSVKMAGLLKKGLEREGYAGDLAGTGEDAIWLAAENGYDAIVLDVILGAGESLLDGFAVCRKIRAADFQTPQLIVSLRDAGPD